jgi:adenylyl-sulfate kinase
MKNAVIFWCSGLSGVGKTTLAILAEKQLKADGLSVLVVDGDKVRASYKDQLGFGRDDVRENNMRIVAMCEAERENFQVIIVPVISPIEEVRKVTRKILEPFFYFIYFSCDIGSLKSRDPKGLYKKADSGEIVDLIGYSASNPYDEPMNADFFLDTSSSVTLDASAKAFEGFIRRKTIEAGIAF